MPESPNFQGENPYFQGQTVSFRGGLGALCRFPSHQPSKAGLSFMAYETLKAQIADLNGDLGVHQRLLLGGFRGDHNAEGMVFFFNQGTCAKNHTKVSTLI